MSPEATVKPFDMSMSEPLAATWQVMAITSPLVCRVAWDTAEALPAALVSEAIAPAVAVPELEAPKAGVAQVSVATMAPAAEMRKTSLLPAPSSWSTTALVAASLLAVECVTAIAMLLQGGEACIMKKAMSLAAPQLYAIGAEFVLWVHDEFQVECFPNQAEMVGKLLVHAMTDAGKHFGLQVKIDGKYKVGKTWAETH